MKITPKQKIFATEFVKSDDASASYRIAYSTSKMKDATVHRNACALLKNEKVIAFVSKLQKIAADEAEKNFRIDSRELLGHLNILRKARIDEYVDFVEIEVPYVVENADGEKEDRVRCERILQFKPFDQLTEEQLMCIESIKDTRNRIELKLHGKDWTIEKIAKHIGFYEKDNIQKNAAMTPEEREKRIEVLKSKI